MFAPLLQSFCLVHHSCVVLGMCQVWSKRHRSLMWKKASTGQHCNHLLTRLPLLLDSEPPDMNHVSFGITSPGRPWYTASSGFMCTLNEEVSKPAGKTLLSGHPHCLLNRYTVRITQWWKAFWKVKGLNNAGYYYYHISKEYAIN